MTALYLQISYKTPKRQKDQTDLPVSCTDQIRWLLKFAVVGWWAWTQRFADWFLNSKCCRRKKSYHLWAWPQYSSHVPSSGGCGFVAFGVVFWCVCFFRGLHSLSRFSLFLSPVFMEAVTLPVWKIAQMLLLCTPVRTWEVQDPCAPTAVQPDCSHSSLELHWLQGVHWLQPQVLLKCEPVQTFLLMINEICKAWTSCWLLPDLKWSIPDLRAVSFIIPTSLSSHLISPGDAQICLAFGRGLIQVSGIAQVCNVQSNCSAVRSWWMWCRRVTDNSVYMMWDWLKVQ